jgi:hypothetical protein
MFDPLATRFAGPPPDLRIFFTFAHGYITKKIGRHVELFANPNALMRLNDSFATTYLNAMNGAPHNDWQRAFRVCRGEEDAVRSSVPLPMNPAGRVWRMFISNGI